MSVSKKPHAESGWTQWELATRGASAKTRSAARKALLGMVRSGSLDEALSGDQRSATSGKLPPAKKPRAGR